MCETFHDRRLRHHRDHGRSQAADTPSSPFRNPTKQAPSSTQATVGLRHARRTNKHVLRHRLTGHETIHNAKLTVKRARRTRAHDDRRHIPRNSRPHASTTHEHLADTTRDKHTRNRFHHHHHTTIVLHTNTVIYTRHPRVRNNAKACNPLRLQLHANATHEHFASTTKQIHAQNQRHHNRQSFSHKYVRTHKHGRADSPKRLRVTTLSTP